MSAARVHIMLLAVLTLSWIGACSNGSLAEDPDIDAGRSLLRRGEFDSARTHFEAALRTSSATGDLLRRATGQKWMGSLFLAYDRPEEALRWYEAGLASLDSLSPNERMSSARRDLADRERRNLRSNLAVTHERLGATAEAETLYLDVLRSDRAAGETTRYAITLGNLGMLYDNMAVEREFSEDSSGSYLLHLRARDLFREALEVHPGGDGWVNYGNNHVHFGSFDSALSCYERAASLYREEGNIVREALVEGNRGYLLMYMLDQPENAVGAFGRSTDLFEQLRGNIASIDLRSSFITDWYHLYEQQISLLVDLQRPEEAFAMAERAKARAFLDLIGNRDVGTGKETDEDVRLLMAEEAELRRHLAALLLEPDSTAILGLLGRRHMDVLAALQELQPEYASLRSVHPVTADELRGMLPPGTALLEYYLGEIEGYAFVVTGAGTRAERLPRAGVTQLEADVSALREMLYREFPTRKMQALREARLMRRLPPAEAAREWHESVYRSDWYWKLVEMYSRLIEPVEAELAGAERLYVVPHGILHQFPFAALVRPGQLDVGLDRHLPRPRYLVEDHSVAYLPSASVLPFALDRLQARRRSGLVVGDPSYADARYRRLPLPGALIEADTVAAYLPDALLLTRAAADERSVVEAMRGRDIIHFATHGELNAVRPMESRILTAVADGCNCDGNLTVAEIFDLDLHASLVALSACQTAQVAGRGGSSEAGDDLVGLTRSFLFAGTPAVLASLWVVDDQATLAWMRSFYRSWLHQGLQPVDAARAASLAMLDAPGDPDWIFPYYWSAFIYFGAIQDMEQPR